MDTGNADRDTHLKIRFFDVDKFPEISFVGNTYESDNDGSRMGDLTVKGIQKDKIGWNSEA